MIAESLEAVGAARSIVIDEAGRVLAGNATQRTAAEKGLRLKVVDVDGKTVVAVRRRDLSEAQKTALALYDNRAAELAEWDPAAIAALGIDLAPFWRQSELRGILEALDEAQAGRTDPDILPKVRSTNIRPGFAFRLGAHRLVCGDSTDPNVVARACGSARAALFATDPPYLVDYTASVRGRRVRARDDEATEDWDDSRQGQAFFDRFLAAARPMLDPAAAWYCWHASRRQAMLEAAWTSAGAFVHQQIIWVKTRASFGRSVYMWRHEPCFFGWIRGQKPRVRQAPLADGHPTTVWEPVDRVTGDVPTTAWFVPSTEVETLEHPTSKPVRLFQIPILMHTDRHEVCLEPFSGSGSQIIAAEQTGRSCVAIEAEPKYVQLAIDRWEAFTGQKATKLGELPHERRRPHGRRRPPAA